MEKTKAIQAVELVRRIRDEQATALSGKSTDEVIAFFRGAAEQARKDAQKRLSRKAIDRPGV